MKKAVNKRQRKVSLRFMIPCMFVALVAAGQAAAEAAKEAAGDAATDGGIYLGLQGGTLGAGPVLGYEFSKQLGVRGQFDWFSYETDEVGDEYTGDLDLRSGSLLVDWNPGGGAFRLTAGAVSNQSEIMAASENAVVDFGGRSYSGTANVQVGFDSVAPYLGVGWSAGRDDGGIRLMIDVGVLIQGTPLVSASGSVNEPGLGTCSFALSTAGVATISGTLCDVASSQDLQADLAAEHGQLTDDLDSLSMWPVLAVGVAYSF